MSGDVTNPDTGKPYPGSTGTLLQDCAAVVQRPCTHPKCESFRSFTDYGGGTYGARPVTIYLSRCISCGAIF